MKDIKINPNVENIVMPENLRVGLMVARAREKCRRIGCTSDYAGFAFGQSPFHVPPPLERALARNADHGHYSAAEGIPELRRAIAGFNGRHFDLDVDPSRIVVGSGTKDLIFTIFFLISGDVIIPSPSWIGYYPQLKLLGRKYHTFYLSEKNDYRILPDDLDEYLNKLACEDKQHLLIINNPNNPTGLVYTKDELIDIASVCRKNNTLILSDEIYALSTYQIENFTSMGRVYPEGTFVTNGLSKDRSAGGYRFGTCILPTRGSDTLRHEFSKIAATVYTNVSTPTQYAAIDVYEPNEEIDEYFSVTRQIHRIMGSYFSEEFERIDGIRTTKPQGSFYFYADFNALSDELQAKGYTTSNDLGRALLGHPFHIATITGDAVMLRADDYGARIAFVDYDGRAAFEDFRANPPESHKEEVDFVLKHGDKMVKGIESLKAFRESLRSSS